jgi:hypothetical protein
MKELYNLHPSPDIIKMKSVSMIWTGHIACIGRSGMSEYKILVGKAEGRRPLGRPRHRWEDNIKMDLRDIGWGGMEWIHLT